MPGSIMVTGGAGYIGSHAVLRLLRDGRDVVVVDNLSRGHAAALERIRAAHPDASLELVRADVSDGGAVAGAIARRGVKDVLHFAALAVVPESVAEPLAYYRNNTAGSIALLETCVAAGVERLILSSTAATYGIPPASEIPIGETASQRPINPYGRSKLAIEWALSDTVAAARAAGRPFAGAALRYFNVAGCDRTGLIGEHHDPETHLIPVVLQHMLGQRAHIEVFGDDYDTQDGSCVRDYIHVEDLVDAHLAVLGALHPEDEWPGDARAYNLGIGRGYSVREIIEAAARVTGRSCDVRLGPRRPGDPPTLCTDPASIRADLGWRPEIDSIDEIISSAWRWFSENPEGYGPVPGATGSR